MKKKYKTKIENESKTLAKQIGSKGLQRRFLVEQKGSTNSPIFLITFDTRIPKEDAFRKLEHDVDAVLVNASDEGTQVFLSIYSPGGPVTAYANAAAQVERLIRKRIPVTVFIDEIAASGGYMMACVATKVVANPMAFVGSIGVVGQIPIFEDALKRLGVHFELFTAGKMKRTVVPFKNPTADDITAVNDKLQGLHTAFKEHVQTYRPQVAETVMDGDYFMAKDHVGTLVDSLGDSHSAVLDAFARNIPLYRVTTEVKRGFSLKRLFGFDTLADDVIESITDRVMAKVFDGGYTGIR